MNIEFDYAKTATYNQLSKLPLGSVQARGWIREQLERNASGMGGHLDELEPDMIATPFINYSHLSHVPDVMTVEETDPSFASGWSGEISGTYWLGLIQLAFTLGDPALIGKASAWVQAVLAHAEPGGYLGSYPPETDRLADFNAWSCNWLYRALLSFYEATRREEVLEAVHKGLLWFCEHWNEHKTDYVGPTIIESMVVVYTYTGDQRLLHFSEDYFVWLETHSIHQNKLSQLLSDKLPYNSMHVVAYGEDAKLPAVAYCASGDEQKLEASVRGIDKAVNRIVQATGAPSSCCEFLSPVGGVTETEYCNFSTFQQSYQWLAMANGQARYGDLIELAMFNGAQGARKKDERAIAYMTSPNQTLATRNSTVYVDVPPTPVQVYAPNFQVGCCPSHSVTMIPEFVRGMCLTDREGGIYILTYSPASVRTAAFSFVMETKYPFEENILLRWNQAPMPPKPLYLRVPSWCESPSVKVNGNPARLIEKSGGFYRLSTDPSSGDVIELVFPMQVKVEKLDDSNLARKYPLVVSRGPLVYALPIPVKWKAYKGSPITPLPDDWFWYEAFPDASTFGERGGHVSAIDNELYGFAVDGSLRQEDIFVRMTGAQGYVWENPPVTLSMPVYRSRYAYAPYFSRNQEPWGQELDTEGECLRKDLVPYGCTNLRITYFYRMSGKRT